MQTKGENNSKRTTVSLDVIALKSLYLNSKCECAWLSNKQNNRIFYLV